MDAFDYLVHFRSDLLERITGIPNAGSISFWDDTPSNHISRLQLETLLRKHLLAAEQLGVYVITRHCDCPNKAHCEYPTTSNYSFSVQYPDPSSQFVWSNFQLFQGKRLCVCPCSASNSASEHHVIDQFVFRAECENRVTEGIASALIDVDSAISSARKNRPRSGIREHLLRALITLNEIIMPETPQEYIARKSVARH